MECGIDVFKLPAVLQFLTTLDC